MFTLRCTLLVFFSVLGALTAAAQDTAPKSSPEQRLIFARKAALEYRLSVGDRSKPEVTLHAEPLLRWINKVVREDDGMLFLWTEGNKGRPVAAAQFFLQETQWHHEFQSLSADRFMAHSEDEDAQGWTWEPSRAGLTFERADRIGPPADSANARLRQMKSIAERFTASVEPGGQFANPEQLRLLTTPIYRYSANAQGILDGAMFAFAQGTNPEVLMMIEADATAPEAKVWRYGFARMSCYFFAFIKGASWSGMWTENRSPRRTPAHPISSERRPNSIARPIWKPLHRATRAIDVTRSRKDLTPGQWVPVKIGGQPLSPIAVHDGLDVQANPLFLTSRSMNPQTSLPPGGKTGVSPIENGTGPGEGSLSSPISPGLDLPTGAESHSVALATSDAANSETDSSRTSFPS